MNQTHSCLLFQRMLFLKNISPLIAFGLKLTSEVVGLIIMVTDQIQDIFSNGMIVRFSKHQT